MAAAAADVLGDRVVSGAVLTHVAAEAPPRFELIQGGHPVPTAGSERAGRRALAIAASLGQGELLLILLSGGGSAIMAVPAEGITLDDKRRATDRLLKAGADIRALNTVRKHLSAIKGGWLAATATGPSLTLAVSDVVGDDLSVIASGPTVPDPSTFDEALHVVERFGGATAYPAPVIARLRAGSRGAAPETPKPGDPRLARARARVIGGRVDAMEAARRAAAARGYAVITIDEPVVGEAREAAVSCFQAVLGRAASAPRPLCVVSSGETTVHVKGSGTGGRNQEFALALVELMASVAAAPVALASVGTDGIDGPTDAAGAVVDSSTLARAARAGLGAPAAYLARNDAYRYFEPLGDLIRTGATDTNVGDLQVWLIG